MIAESEPFALARQPEVGDALAEHDAARKLRERHPTAFETKGTVREARGLASIT